MSLHQRRVYGTVYTAGGITPLADALVICSLEAGSFTSGGTFVPSRVQAVTDDAGYWFMDLWAEDDGSIRSAYRIRFPNDHIWKVFDLPFGDGSPISVETLIGAGLGGTDPSATAILTGLIETHADASDTHSFLHLTDTPDTYAGQSAKIVAVNGGEGGLEFVDIPDTGPTTLSALDDVALTSPADADILSYESGTAKWLNTPLPDYSGTYDALGAADAVQTNLDAEATARASGDTTLQDNIDAEAATRASADSTLTSFIGGVSDDLATHAALTTTAHGGIVASTDSRLTDARTPTAHASSHISTGTDAIPDATISQDGLLSSDDKSKLDGIEAGATQNQTDAYLLDRAHHTGTQTAATISDLAEAVDDRVSSLLVEGANITLTYDDTANTLTIDAAGGGGGSGYNGIPITWEWADEAARLAESVTADDAGKWGLQVDNDSLWVLRWVLGSGIWEELSPPNAPTVIPITDDAGVFISPMSEIHGPEGFVTDLGAGGAQLNVMVPANNLSDLANAPAARTNLGLDTASTHPATDFDSAGAAATVQGNLATHAALTTAAHGGLVATTDSRLTDARTPTAHAASHATGASDALALSAITGLALYNLKDYGAVGNGIADDTTPITNWLAAAAGAIAFAPTGTYLTSGNHSIPTGTIIMGCGWATIFKLKNTSNTHIFTATGISNFVLRDFKIDGNRTNQSSNGRGINLSTCNDGLILNVWTTSSFGHSFNFSNCNRMSLVDCKGDGITTAANAFQVFQGTNINTIRCQALGGNSAIYYDGVVGGLIQGCVATPSAGGHGGINLKTGASGVRVIGNYCTGQNDGHSGIEVYGNGNVIAGNVCDGAGNGFGIEVSAALASAVNYDAAYNTVVGNVCKNGQGGATGAGIYLRTESGSGTAHHNVIASNECFDDQVSPTQAYGIKEVSPSDNNRFDGNITVNNVTAQLVVVGASSSVTKGNNTGDQDLSGKLDKNVAIAGATKTKVTYDAKGLVTAGADATTADIADSSNKRYVTDAELTVLGNTSGVNTGDQVVPSFATPSIALGTAAAAGSASTVIRSDATIVAFDATAPSTQTYGDSAAAGTATVAARRDHKHAMPAIASDATITTTDITTNDVSTSKHGWAPKGDGNAAHYLDGTGAYSIPAASTSFATPALTLGTSNAAGSASTAVRTDATILAFDATAPSTQAFGDAAAAGSATVAARRDHKHAMPAALYEDKEIIIDGAGLAITTGIKGDIRFSYACTIVDVVLLADQSGSIVFDLWKDTYANYSPTVADTITASAKPTISSATKAQDTTLTGWTTSIAAGDIIRVNVDSCSSITRCTLALKVQRT